MEFIKGNYSKEYAEAKMQELVEETKSKLKKGYEIDGSNYSTSNGLSIYISVKKDGDEKPFQFRISDHKNGINSTEIMNGSLSYKMNGLNLHAMYKFYGDLTEKEYQVAICKEYFDKYSHLKGSNGYKSVEKRYQKLMSQDEINKSISGSQKKKSANKGFSM